MEILIRKEKHKVIYIQYSDKLPHEVLTISYNKKTQHWGLCTWDFFANDGNRNDIRAYESGGGGDYKKIQAPQFADGHIGEYWMDKICSFKGKSKNAKRLDKPIRLKGYLNETSINPFKIAEITYSREYCEMCGTESTEFCTKHKYEDEQGNEKWIHNNEYCS